MAKKWYIRDAISVILVYMIIWVILGIFLSESVDSPGQFTHPFYFYLGEMFDAYLLIGLTFYMLINSRGAKLSDIGLVDMTRLRNWLVGFAIGIGTWIVTTALYQIILRYLGPSSFEHPYTLMIKNMRNPGDYVLLLIIAVVLGPLSEEIFFRGFFYPPLRARYGVHIAVLISSGIFALVHLNPLWIPSVLIASIVLTYLFEFTGSLVGPIAAHSIASFMTFLEIVYLS